MKYLVDFKTVKASQLIEMFGVSLETVRRDLKCLEEQGKIKRVHGGAVIDSQRSLEISYLIREGDNLAEKRAIGQAAASLIQDGDTVVMNSGTTVFEVAKSITARNNLTVITNSMHVAMTLAANKSIRVFVVGGELRNPDQVTSGFWSVEFLRHFRADKAVIGIGGIDIASGVTDYHSAEANIWSEMVKIASKCIIVADYSKFGISALNLVCDLRDIEYLVTDWNTPGKELSRYREQRIKVIVAKP